MKTFSIKQIRLFETESFTQRFKAYLKENGHPIGKVALRGCMGQETNLFNTRDEYVSMRVKVMDKTINDSRNFVYRKYFKVLEQITELEEEEEAK